MSVIVAGMDMPYYCGKCGGCYDYANDKYFCALDDNSFDVVIDKEVKRHKDCPLKSIDGLLEKITQLPTQKNTEGQDMYQAYDVLRTIREYCEVKE